MRDSVILVDDNDNPLGYIDKLEAHQKGLLHRAVSVFIFNSKHELLLQRRALNKYHSPGLWSNTACTHPYPNETISDAAIRRLNEEMGIKDAQLFKLFDFIYNEKLNNELIEHEYDHVFMGLSDATPILNLDEVCEYKYSDIYNILDDIKVNPDKYTIWFKIIFNRVFAFIENNFTGIYSNQKIEKK